MNAPHPHQDNSHEHTAGHDAGHGTDHGAMDHSAMDHGAMDQGMGHGAMDHSAMDHSAMNHAAMGHGMGHAGMDHAGMDHSAMGHGGHAGHIAMFRRRFWIMLALAVPVVASNAMFAHLVGLTLPDWPWLPWVSPVLGTIMFAWGGWPFLTGAVSEIRAKSPGMMLLIGTAITVAFIASWGASLGLLSHELDFWWELALLIVIMLLGHWIEMRALAQTTSALDALAALLPDEAELVTEDGTRTVAPSALAVGDVVLVRPGATVPADGEVVDGSASMDESMITGESRTVTRTVGDPVVAGTVSTDSALRVRVTAVGDATALAGIRRLVADAQSTSSRAQRIADVAARWLFWFALVSAVLTAIVWTLVGDPANAVLRAITVLVIACPHALGLAIPLVVSIATERAARAGVLVSDRLALETMRTVDTVLFDKTGTLTKGEPAVIELAPSHGVGEDDVLALAAAAESASEHPLAGAIVRAARERSLTVPPATDFAASPALGVVAHIEGSEVHVGGPRMLEEQHAEQSPRAEQWLASGSIVLHVVRDGETIGAISLADEIRPESRDAVAALHAMGVRVAMVTGDARATADAVAKDLGIDDVFAEVRPEGKAEIVRSLRSQGRRVAMVGDGVNDAPALAGANVGIAIGAGTDVAIGSAGVVLASADPRSIVSVIELSRASYRTMRQNLWWAAGYNLLAVPLAAGVLAPIGFTLPMSVGAILMSVSTIVVALNAQLLRRVPLDPARVTREAIARAGATSTR